MEPHLVGIKGGWAALGRGWAVFGDTKDDALAKYYAAIKRHEVIMARPWPWEISQEGDGILAA